MQSVPSLLTVRQFTEKHHAFTNGAIRNFIHMARPRRSAKGMEPGNGFEVVIKRIGRRIYIDEVAFFEWIDRRGGI